MLWLLLAHIVGLIVVSLAGRDGSMHRALGVAAIAPAVTAGWALVKLLAGDSAAVPTADFMWVDGLGIGFSFRADALALLMTLLVSGIGALVFVYAIGYFAPDAAGATRFPASLLAFSGSMLGLVWADSVWTLFIFWELTSITSFLLVGHKHTDSAVRTAARRALLITGAGGLVLLAGLIIVANEGGTTSLTAMTPLVGTSASVAAVLVLVGAATKSAQVPFHVWLPGAMAAPTPVSAYLHSATMVKAGVFLVASVGPIFTEVAAWKIVGGAFGVTSMLWGAIGALRHLDAKLILAWGTVSQLGLLVTLFAIGSPKATFAGVAILLAHALFKAALFLVVGEIDIRTGTRDIRELVGLRRSMPIAFGVALAAGLSMAGAPPLLGFMAKEAAIEAALDLDGTERLVFLTALVVGSTLTVAYTTRFLLTVFGSWGAADGRHDTEVAAARPAMAMPSVLLAAVSVAGYFVVAPATALVSDAAVELAPKAAIYELIPWPGLKTAFVVSIAILAAGALLGLAVARREITGAPHPYGADGADAAIDGILAFAPRLSSVVQHGSLPVYVATMGAAAVIASAPFLTEVTTDGLVWSSHPFEPVLTIAIAGAAFAGTMVGSRLGAALILGAVGLGVSALFVIRGAPDLALTQLLVETIIVVGFVLGLGGLRQRFPASNNTWKTLRIVLSGAGGVAVVAALAAAQAAPSGQAPLDDLVTAAVDEGGGKNVVNVILTDLRALDTLGEVVVLATVAVGVLALARVRDLEADR